MATERQIDANRRNARKSTGPRTSKGKTRSAQNALKHGLLAKPALLPDEDEKAYRDFIEERIRELDPVGSQERYVSEQIVFHEWRLLRCARVEAGLFISDRADREYRYYWDQLMQYRSSGLERDLQKLGALNGSQDSVVITDEVRHAEAMEKLSAAAEAKRGEDAFLALAFSSAAANGDPFGKLCRYETALLNRLLRLRAELDGLQARRREVQQSDRADEVASSW